MCSRRYGDSILSTCINQVPLLLQLLQFARHPLHVVQDHHIRDEVVVLDNLALLVTEVFRDRAVTAEHQPLRKIVELLLHYKVNALRVKTSPRSLQLPTSLDMVMVPSFCQERL